MAVPRVLGGAAAQAATYPGRMTRGTRVGTTIVGFLAVFAPAAFAVSVAFGLVAVAETLLFGAFLLLVGHARDARAAELAEVISLAAVREALAEPPATGRLAVVTELSRHRKAEPTRLPLAR